MVKKIFTIKGMHCNSCARIIENKLKSRVNSISVSYAKETAEIDFDESKITYEAICAIIEKLGYSARESDIEVKKTDKTAYYFLAGIFTIVILVFLLSGKNIQLPEIEIPEIGEKTSLVLLFLIGLLTGFHCISMCGGFVVSYAAKNAINGHKGFSQHLVYGGSKVLSYSVIGGIFGLIGGIFAFSIALRGTIAILAGVFMVFYALSMFGLKFFKRFQFNPKFLYKLTSKTPKGPYQGPFFTGLLNGLFIACGPLQAMYLYAAGTGSLISGASGLAAFGLGTLPLMIGFGSLASAISHKATARILKVSAVIVLILGLIMINRGLALTGSSFTLDSLNPLKSGSASAQSKVINGVQEINMDVTASGWSPNSFALKKGIPVKWNINVKQLTGCNKEIIVKDYNLDIKLKQGLNVVEFTPAKEGTIRWSCWMGMIQGSFLVTESGEATTEQLAAAKPKSSGGCGCGRCGG